jgi:hypothetical protein
MTPLTRPALGHADELFGEDQWCWTATTTVPATHYPSEAMGDGTHRPTSIGVWGMRPPESLRGGGAGLAQG